MLERNSSCWIAFSYPDLAALSDISSCNEGLCYGRKRRLYRHRQGPQSNFKIGGAPLVTQYWEGGGHKTLFIILKILRGGGGARA